MWLRECGAQRHNAKAWLQEAWKIWSLKWPAPPKGTPEVLYLYFSYRAGVTAFSYSLLLVWFGPSFEEEGHLYYSGGGIAIATWKGILCVWVCFLFLLDKCFFSPCKEQGFPETKKKINREKRNSAAAACWSHYYVNILVPRTLLWSELFWEKFFWFVTVFLQVYSLAFEYYHGQKREHII